VDGVAGPATKKELPMHRLAALLLCSSLAAVVAWAAPAPVYKADRTRWLGMDGWDAPIDRHGDCRFGRDRDKLVLTVPTGKARPHDVTGRRRRRDAPYLARPVEGDFAVRVRVAGQFGPPGGGCRGAGLLLMDGEESWLLLRWAGVGKNRAEHSFDGYCAAWRCSYLGKYQVKKSYLRLVRRGDRVSMHASEDGVDWVDLEEQKDCNLPRRLKVGVIATRNVIAAWRPSSTSSS
jgi:regulation of enolase protein 1 (concanavalin A-like superfamily)